MPAHQNRWYLIAKDSLSIWRRGKSGGTSQSGGSSCTLRRPSPTPIRRSRLPRNIGLGIWPFLLLAVVLLVSPGSPRAQSERWTQLFNGRDLAGWVHVSPGTFAVEDKMLKTEGGMGLLWYCRKKISDSTLRVVFKLTHDMDDSGVFIRIPDKPTDPWIAVNRGYEVEIGNWPDDYSCTGAVYTFTKALARPLKPTGEWNTMDVTLDGARTIVFLNGIRVTDYKEGDPVPAKRDPHDPDRGPRPIAGYIGLQNYSQKSAIYFREVAVRPLQK